MTWNDALCSSKSSCRNFISLLKVHPLVQCFQYRLIFSRRTVDMQNLFSMSKSLFHPDSHISYRIIWGIFSIQDGHNFMFDDSSIRTTPALIRTNISLRIPDFLFDTKYETNNWSWNRLLGASCSSLNLCNKSSSITKRNFSKVKLPGWRVFRRNDGDEIIPHLLMSLLHSSFLTITVKKSVIAWYCSFNVHIVKSYHEKKKDSGSWYTCPQILLM